MIDQVAEKIARRVILGILLGGLLVLSYAVLQPFIVPVAWAGIIAYATWPLYRRLRASMRRYPTLAALLMTLMLTAALVLPALWLASLLRTELGTAISTVTGAIRAGTLALPDFIRNLPWAGDALQRLLEQLTGDPENFGTQMNTWVRQGLDQAVALIGDVGRNAAKLGFALITVFFFYRDGDKVLRQVQKVLRRFLGERVDGYLVAVGSMTKAVVWGLVATALAQGVVAGLGYWWAGVAAPILLSAVTALIAMIPFGTPFAWGSIGIWLLISGDTVGGIGLLLWGALVVSWVDNLVRPLVISNATRIPFVLVMFGVLGGLAAFGLVGLFLGPVVLAVLMAVWREWMEESELLRAGLVAESRARSSSAAERSAERKGEH
ncbi:permease [Thauera terpenica 58Eu]|jgi:predicted PurR-regulated permease PerM|uniref:Permease n=1 Tax=Thauera terpenica 58Eu TaxID=1348657 RepID=S9ZCG2_9RHOO|nr:AI-2E family transporter [Thauera terpenica]EPZ14980.1 permease [Thauera terpenica 58Eu]